MRRACNVLLCATLIALTAMIAPAPADASATSVSMAHYAFSPAALTITAGDSVTWTNSDVAQHDVMTTDGPASIHSPMLSKGQSWTYTFTEPGTYRYICMVHPDMIASLTVLPAPAPAPKPVQQAQVPVQTTAALAPVPKLRTPRRTQAAPPTATPAAAVHTHAQAEAGQPLATTTTQRLNPLLLAAGLVAGVATLALLLLAGAPERSQA